MSMSFEGWPWSTGSEPDQSCLVLVKHFDAIGDQPTHLSPQLAEGKNTIVSSVSSDLVPRDGDVTSSSAPSSYNPAATCCQIGSTQLDKGQLPAYRRTERNARSTVGSDRSSQLPQLLSHNPEAIITSAASMLLPQAGSDHDINHDEALEARLDQHNDSSSSSSSSNESVGASDTDNDHSSIDSDHKAWRRQRRKELKKWASVAIPVPRRGSLHNTMHMMHLSSNAFHPLANTMLPSSSSSDDVACMDDEQTTGQETNSRSSLLTASHLQQLARSHSIATTSRLTPHKLVAAARAGYHASENAGNHVHRWLIDHINVANDGCSEKTHQTMDWDSVLPDTHSHYNRTTSTSLSAQVRAIRAALRRISHACALAIHDAYSSVLLGMTRSCMVRRTSVELVSQQNNPKQPYMLLGNGQYAGGQCNSALNSSPHPGQLLRPPGVQNFELEVPAGLLWTDSSSDDMTDHESNMGNTANSKEHLNANGIETKPEQACELQTGAEGSFSVLALDPDKISQLSHLCDASSPEPDHPGCVRQVLHDDAHMRITSFTIAQGVCLRASKPHPWPCTLHVLNGCVKMQIYPAETAASCSTTCTPRTFTAQQGSIISLSPGNRVSMTAATPAATHHVNGEGNDGEVKDSLAKASLTVDVSDNDQDSKHDGFPEQPLPNNAVVLMIVMKG